MLFPYVKKYTLTTYRNLNISLYYLLAYLTYAIFLYRLIYYNIVYLLVWLNLDQFIDNAILNTINSLSGIHGPDRISWSARTNFSVRVSLLFILTLIGKFPGHEIDRFTENSSNQNLWVPIQFCSNSRYELDRFLENSSKT